MRPVGVESELRRLASIFARRVSGRSGPVLAGLWGLIVSGGYDRSAGIARGAGFPGPESLSGRLDGGPGVHGKAARSRCQLLEDCGRPPPGGVDPQADLTRSSGDAGGDVQDPVAEGVDLTGGQIGMLGEADQFARPPNLLPPR